VYFYNENGDGYRNSGSTGTRGFEVDYKIKNALGYADFNLAYYCAKGKSKSENYMVSEENHMLLAFPGITASSLINIRITDWFSLNPSLTWMGSRYEVSGTDEEGNNTYLKHDPSLLANFFAGLKTKRFNVSAGCANLLNKRAEYIQPYNSNHASLPGRSREFRIIVRYDLIKGKK
jgi:hypothetical protein